FDQMVVLEVAFPRHAMLPHVVGNLVTGPGSGHNGLGIQLTDAPGRKDGGLYAVGREEFEEAPDTDASAKLAFSELHGRLVIDPPHRIGLEVHGRVPGHAHARRVGKVLKVHVSRTIALGSRTELLEFTLHCTGHLDLSFGATQESLSLSSYLSPEPVDQTTGPLFDRRHSYPARPGYGLRRVRVGPGRS